MKKQLDINTPELIDARLALKNWLNTFLGKGRKDVIDMFGEEHINEDDWEEEGEQGIVLEYECHDYTLEFYIYNDEIVSTSFITFSS